MEPGREWGAIREAKQSVLVLSEEVKRLEAENAELRRDKERLDWMEQWCGVTVTGGTLTRWSLFYDLVPDRPTYGSTFRGAIDAAKE